MEIIHFVLILSIVTLTQNLSSPHCISPKTVGKSWKDPRPSRQRTGVIRYAFVSADSSTLRHKSDDISCGTMCSNDLNKRLRYAQSFYFLGIFHKQPFFGIPNVINETIVSADRERNPPWHRENFTLCKCIIGNTLIHSRICWLAGTKTSHLIRFYKTSLLSLPKRSWN